MLFVFLFNILTQALAYNRQFMFVVFYFKDFIYLSLERGGEKERERNINVWLPFTCPPTEDLACNPGICPDWELNQRPFGSQASTQSTEPHQPELFVFLIYFLNFSVAVYIQCYFVLVSGVQQGSRQ